MIDEFEYGEDSGEGSSSSAEESEKKETAAVAAAAFVCLKETLAASSSNSEGGESGDEEEEDDSVVDPKGWRAFRPRLRAMLEPQQLQHIEHLEATLQKMPERAQGPEAVAELESIVGRYIRRACAAGMPKSPDDLVIIDL
ncbi:hypothetical protein ETH_00018185, partial [Eimeria tenella]